MQQSMNTVTVEVAYEGRNYSIHAIPDDHITRQMVGSGRFYESDLLKEIARRKLSGTYLDVGAHIGNHSAFFASECPSTLVWAFEPNLTVWSALSPNRWTFDFLASPFAIHDEWKAAKLVTVDPANLGMCKIEEGTQTACIRLDDFGTYDDPVCLIKVDVEGCEISVLKSAESMSS